MKNKKIKNKKIKKMNEMFSFHKVGMKVCKLYHQADNTVIPIHIMATTFTTIMPFLTIYLSSKLIENLSLKNYHLVGKNIVILLLCNLIFGILEEVIKEYTDYKINNLYIRLTTLIRERALSMDFSMIEDADIVALVTGTEKTAQWRGGMSIFMKKYSSLYQQLLTAIISIGMIITMCMKRPNEVTESKFLSLVNSPLVSILYIIFLVILLSYFNGSLIKKFSEKQNNMQDDTLVAEHQLSYILFDVFLAPMKGQVIRQYNMDKKIMSFYEGWMAKSQLSFRKLIKVLNYSSLLESIWNSILLVFSYVLVILKVVGNAITIGEFTRYIGVLTMFNMSFGRILQENEGIRSDTTYFEPILKFMDMETTTKKGTIPVEKRQDNVYEIEFHNVSFAYPNAKDNSVNNLSCKINLKEKISIVGRNGAGKTTFIKLLCGLYEPTKGKITLNGIDIKKYNHEEYINLFGVVFQDYSLFSYSIKENVSILKDASDSRVNEVLEKAGVYKKIISLDKGIDSILLGGDDTKLQLSGGETQKVAIARALYKDAPILILDEPTAALDPISEYEIYKEFDKMVEDKTSLYISHRMSSCRFCDTVYVFDEGRLKEKGNHQDLMKLDGIYRNLWTAQAKYYEGT